MIYFISDLHFNHDKEFLYGYRGFDSIEEHNKEIVKRFNSKVSDDDTVYILGDVAMGDMDSSIELLKQLKGHKHLIRGNHCTNAKVARFIEENIFESIQYATQIKYGKFIFYLSHYEAGLGPYEGEMGKIWCLHGHTHSKNIFNDFAKNYNVAPEAHDCYPVEIEEIIADIRKYWELNQKYLI